jgi:hypothetical protein
MNPPSVKSSPKAAKKLATTEIIPAFPDKWLVNYAAPPKRMFVGVSITRLTPFLSAAFIVLVAAEIIIATWYPS